MTDRGSFIDRNLAESFGRDVIRYINAALLFDAPAWSFAEHRAVELTKAAARAAFRYRPDLKIEDTPSLAEIPEIAAYLKATGRPSA